MIEINLLPGAKRRRGAKGVAFQMPDFKALLTTVKDPWLIACVATWTLVIAGFGLLYLPRRTEIGRLQPRLDDVKAEAQSLEQALRVRQGFEAKRDTVEGQIGVIRDIDRDRYTWPHILDAIAKALPPYTWLDDVTSMAAEAGDAASSTTGFQITGKSADIQAITRFVRNLEESPFIEGATTRSTGAVNEQGRNVFTFILSARYQVPDTALLTMEPLAASVVRGVRSGGGARGARGR
ncbi:MAG: PilN domain-containing protein [Gemmatimonadetes bacterium]|nr:PilN domain-containing protein [Gemmatimonadota bacterium]